MQYCEVTYAAQRHGNMLLSPLFLNWRLFPFSYFSVASSAFVTVTCTQVLFIQVPTVLLSN
jgi:hypothetical protein